MSMPAQKPGRSKQDYQTPPAFLAAIKHRLHIDAFAIDLAASKENAVADVFYTEEDDSLNPHLKWDWYGCWGWLNPPFGHLEPWVAKAASEAKKGAHIAMLVPAAVGSNWWKTYVDETAHVLFLNGRLTFVGAKGPYPKDCALLLYTPYCFGGYEVWKWKSQVPQNV